MLDFRKVLLALSVAGLGLVSTASAQITCSGGVTAPFATLRAEGMTEQYPALTLAGCTSAASPGGTTNSALASVNVTTNVPITNVLLNSTTTNSTDAIATLMYTGPGTACPAPNGALSCATAQGQLISSTTMQFNFTLPAPPISVTGGNVVISNIRVNASANPAGTAITAGVSSGTGLAVTGTPTSASVLAQASIGSVVLTGYNNLAICSVASTQVNVVATAIITEGFVSAFTTTANEVAIEPAGPATNPAGTGTGAVTNEVIGSRLAVTYGNLVAGVNYYIPVLIDTTTAAPAGTLKLALVAAANSPDSSTLPGGTIGTSKSTGYPGGAVGGVYQLTPTNGSATVYYAVTADNPLGIDATSAATVQNPYSVGPPPAPANVLAPAGQLDLYEVVPSGSTATGVSVGPTILVQMAGNSTGYPQFNPTPLTAPLTVKATNPAAPAGTTASTGILAGCNTTMIFPFIETYGGYDTGLAITNAGPGSTVINNTVTPTTAGTCSLSLWGSASPGGTPYAVFTLSPVLSVAAGTVNDFALSSVLPAADTPFIGYMIATCNFQGAHGFGFVFGGAGGSTVGAGLSQGYLAPILADVYGSPSVPQSINDPI